MPQVLAGSGVERIDVTVDSVEETDCIGAPDSPIQCVAVSFGLPDGDIGSFVLTPSVSTPRFVMPIRGLSEARSAAPRLAAFKSSRSTVSPMGAQSPLIPAPIRR